MAAILAGHTARHRGVLGFRSDAGIGFMHAPADPNSDGWISFRQSSDGRYELIDADRFVLPRDLKSGDRGIDPCAIGYFPPHVKSVLGAGDLGALETPEAFSKPTEFDEVLLLLTQPTPPAALAAKGKFDTDLKRLRKLEEEMARNTCQWKEAFGTKSPADEEKDRNLLADYMAAHYAEVLFLKAKHGDPIAAERLLSLVMLLIKKLDELGKSSPATVEALQKWNIRWPRLVGNHPFYRTQADPPQKLGSGYPFKINSGNRWNPESPITKVAVHLILYVTRLQSAAKRFMDGNANKVVKFEQSLCNLLPLGDLQDNAPAWWEEAWLHFTARYPHPEDDWLFRQWVQGETHKKSPGRIRERIRSKLRDAFLSVSGYSKFNLRNSDDESPNKAGKPRCLK